MKERREKNGDAIENKPQNEKCYSLQAKDYFTCKSINPSNQNTGRMKFEKYI